MLAIVGESGSGKTTLLNVLSGRLAPDRGIVWYRDPAGHLHDVHAMPAPALRTLHRSDWGFVHQDPRQNLRMAVSAGGNVGERLMAQGARHYGDIRDAALDWLAQVEIDADRIDDLPRTFSGGMLQRLQIARTLVTHPAPGVHGRTHRRPRRFCAGTTARPDPLAGHPAAHRRGAGHPRHRRRPPAGAPDRGHAARPHRRDRADRPGAGRPAATPTRSCSSVRC